MKETVIFVRWVSRVMSGLRVERLKRRARRFLDDANEDLAKGYYDVALFHVEQTIQLYVKGVILELFGKEYTGHGVRELLSYLAKLLDENGYKELSLRVSEFTRENRLNLLKIEDAYISSRYEDVEYDVKEAEESLGLAEKLIALLDEVVDRVKLG
ncbi:MAG: HEPN domain-containing protein [Candidatus Aramenus sp.]|jgi:HEPN domain-containing protein|nr:HEPN domain-containing protein [Candidatus Aramenus sp.]